MDEMGRKQTSNSQMLLNCSIFQNLPLKVFYTHTLGFHFGLLSLSNFQKFVGVFDPGISFVAP